ncbi:hypothetical protein LA080_003841 [Diaporthe eres]|nr:hypothetical protein LA080_003841 [Diaporthe eres]
MMTTSLDQQQILALTAGEIGKMLRSHTLSVVDVIKATGQRIQEHNSYGLNLAAIISVAPEANVLKLAEQLDRELAENKPRGLYMGFQGDGLKDGFSPVGGQTNSPYIQGGILFDEGDVPPSSPSESSTGSAVNVSAGFAFIAIGTENNGSIVQPSSRQAVYSLKPTRGLIDCSGAFRVSKTLDTPGAMARSARDVAVATAAMLNNEMRSSLPGGSYEHFFRNSFAGLTVGFVDPALWRLPARFWVPSEEAKQQHDASYHAVIQKMKTLGAKVVYPVELPAVEKLKIGDEWAPEIVNLYENAATTENFFAEYFEADSSVRNLADVVQYNKDHPGNCVRKNAPDQSTLIKVVENPPTEVTYHAAFARMQTVSRDEGIDRVVSQNDFDVVLVPMDSSVCSLSTVSGYPIVNVPLGRYHLKGKASRPFGLAIHVKAGGEGTLFKVMKAYEANFPPRVVPEQL